MKKFIIIIATLLILLFLAAKWQSNKIIFENGTMSTYYFSIANPLKKCIAMKNHIIVGKNIINGKNSLNTHEENKNDSSVCLGIKKWGKEYITKKLGSESYKYCYGISFYRNVDCIMN